MKTYCIEIPMNKRKLIHLAAVDLHKGYIGREMYGLCWNIHDKVNVNGFRVDLTPALEKLFRKWPKYSGDKAFPIPSPRKDEHPSECYFLHAHNEWNRRTAYGRLRWELLDFIIEQTA